LVTGENTLVVTVTAADGETTQDYTVTLVVALNTDASLATFTINGEDVADGDSISVPANTGAVEVVAVATDANATIDIAGGDALEAGDNSVVVTVTAADGETVETYTVTVTVELSTETGVSEILVDGQVAIDNDVILASDPSATEVDVTVTTIDENATVDISGNTELVAGDNTITIVVTAPSGDERTYTITLRTKGLSGNAKLSSLVVGGNLINLANDTASVSLPAGSNYVSVIPTAQDSAASIAVIGNKALAVGDNTVTVRVTAPDGKTTKEYTVIVTVAALSTNVNLSSILVNGTSVASGGTLTVAAGAAYAQIVATAEDSTAVISYSGFKNLVAGNNTATIRVTAAAGNYFEYNITLVVPTLSNDTSLKLFTIEGFNMLGKSKLTVLPGTSKLHVSAQANFAGASVSISGRDIVAGINTVTVTVTAADGSTRTYTVQVKA